MPDEPRDFVRIGDCKIPVESWEMTRPLPPEPGELVPTEELVISSDNHAPRTRPTKFGRQYRAKRAERN